MVRGYLTLKRFAVLAKTLMAWREEEELFFHIMMGAEGWPVLTQPTVAVKNSRIVRCHQPPF